MISPTAIADTAYWLAHFRDIWETNPPLRLHTRALDQAGNPDMTTDFLHWLDGTSGRHEGSEDRARLKRAMKRLRERSLRESEVVHRTLVQGHSIPDTTAWLNTRAGHETFGDSETLVILYAGIDKLREWY